MNLRISRAVAGAGVAALALAGPLALGAPAFAADDQADLAVTVNTSAVVADTSKSLLVTVENKGPAAATGVKVTIDLSGLDKSKVDIIAPDPSYGCTLSGDTVNCAMPDMLAGAFEKAEIGITGTAVGDAGTLKASVTSDVTDPDSTNNEATQAITVVSGETPQVDVVAYALDVYADYDTRAGVPVGESAPLLFGFFTFGNAYAQGLDFHVKLPEHVSFAKVPTYCKVAGSVATCARPDVLMEPDYVLSIDKDEFVVTVDADAPAPVALTGGMIDGAAEGIASPRAAAAASTTPTGFTKRAATKQEIVDADTKDNSDNFTVFDAVATGGTGGGSDDEGGLPVTGARAGLIGGVGGAVLVAGFAVMMVARRRRVVMVSPTDPAGDA